ncbi:DUF2868 domain-containing protein [Nitrosomonas sp. ANs5]|uniref:DUF2868 domain-containing protein n=1 Tax=Nitrosomonas sp. ANs5 TaxID=3423941 RepID=UPI003D34702C
MANKNHSFSDLVRLEQLRHIETHQAQALSYASIADMEPHAAPGFSYTVFFEKLLSRARRLIQDNALNNTLQQPEKLFLRAGRVVLLLAALLGGLAAGNAVGASATLNIYWLLAVLLGFNFLSMLLWGAGMLFNVHGLNSGVAAQLACWLPSRLKDKDSDKLGSLAARAWWETCLTGKVGKWRISLLTHQFWLAYLLAGMSILILLMMARQYDFVWGTTLLPESSLPELTRLLAAPMEYFGLTPPDSQQIAASRVGADMQDASTRTTWAKFLLATLMLYGLLPRLALTLLSSFMLKLSERRFKLDLYLPYYVTLRQRLIASEFTTSVIDADPGIAVNHAEPVPGRKNRDLPAEASAIGIELDDQMIWPEGINCQQNIIDQASFARMIDQIKATKGSLLIGVAAHRLPDRGVQRMIAELVAAAAGGPVWLMLLRSRTSISVTESRKLAWFRLAQACSIPAENVITQ